MEKTIATLLALVMLLFTGSSLIASDGARTSASGTVILAASGGEAAGGGLLPARPTHEGDRDREVLGTVVSIDTKKNEIILKDEYSQVDKPIRLHAEDMPKVKVGDYIKVILTHNTNVARTVLHVEEKSLDPNK